jgi:8-hydroxy-5-deazaflavin:NADPH oxidoreductase
MKIGIIGTGNMGRVLGGLWASKGHEVFFGARDAVAAQTAKMLAEQAGGATVHSGSNDAAAAFGDVLLYSPRGIDPAEVVADISAFDGKIVIDLNNWAIPDNFAYEPITLSLAERLQSQLPRAKVVKAFNTMAQEVLEADATALQAAQVTVYVATDHDDARPAVDRLARDLYLSPLDSGQLRMARLLEGLGDLVRYFIIGQKGVMSTINFAQLPQATTQLFGDRTPSSLDEKDKRTTVTVTKTVAAPIDILWSEVSNFSNLSRWHPDVASAELLDNATGTQPGNIRLLTLRNGMQLKEKLLAIDPAQHSYSYTVLDGQLPLSAHSSTLTMTSLGSDTTQITWTASFQADATVAGELASSIRSDVIELGIEGLRKQTVPNLA